MKKLDCANFKYLHPRGPIYGYITEKGLQTLVLPSPTSDPVYELHSSANVVLGKRLRDMLESYFAGIAVDFRSIPLDLDGATPFRRAVWAAAQELAWGQSCSYGELAERMGCKPGSSRAVGQALGANPVPIVVPCHRILAANHTLGGFGCGLDWKRELLSLERISWK